LDLGRSEIKSLEKAWSFKDGGSKEENQEAVVVRRRTKVLRWRGKEIEVKV
jgi:hypothetical protein